MYIAKYKTKSGKKTLMFIYIFGPDGVGKTTHARLLAYYLRRMGKNVWQTSIKHHHVFIYLVFKLLSFCGVNTILLSYYGFSEKIKKGKVHLWKIFEYISILIAIVFKVCIPMLLGYTIICDRYVIDTIVTLSYFLREPYFFTSTYARSLIKLIPKQALLIHLDADTKTILARKKDEPLSYYLISYYKLMYNIITKVYSIKSIKLNTTNTSIRETFKLILMELNRVLNQTR